MSKSIWHSKFDHHRSHVGLPLTKPLIACSLRNKMVLEIAQQRLIVEP